MTDALRQFDTFGKLVSKMRQTAQILYIIYIALTIIEIILLFAGGMPLFDICYVE